eukprot:6462115-Pyramimonas_sp.AAC.1
MEHPNQSARRTCLHRARGGHCSLPLVEASPARRAVTCAPQQPPSTSAPAPPEALRGVDSH